MKSGDVLAGRFEVGALAGKGGMGRVYRAYDRTQQTFVAVKVLAENSSKQAARFDREMNILADLSCANIVRHLERGTTDEGLPYFVMDWLEGEDLSKRIARADLTLAETLAIITGTATALAAAHAKQILHRDVKPSNIFLVHQQFEHIKLLDFGIARGPNNDAVTTTGGVVGTPAYMAPEYAQEEVMLDARADVFSLGCVFYECLTRIPAFAGAHWLSILAKILTTDPPRLRELRPDVPGAVEALVMRMMAKEPKDRPRDAAAVLEELERLGSAHDLVQSASVAITNAERRSFCLLLARRHVEQASSQDATLQDADADSASAWQRAVKTWGGRLRVFPDGLAMIVMDDMNVATDAAARAARCALWLRTNTHADAIAITTWVGRADSHISAAEAVDQGTMSLLSFKGSKRECSIFIDATTSRLLDGRFDVREDVAGCVLSGERNDALNVRLLLGKLTPCMGREIELATLAHRLDDCLDEHAARAVLVYGAAGMGKSRLVQEFLLRLKAYKDAVNVWIGGADALRTSSTFGLLACVVRYGLGIRGDEVLADGRAKVVSRVKQHVDVVDQQRVSEFLCELIGLPCRDESSILLRTARRHVQTMADEMRRAWIDFLRAECRAKPVVIILEDLHWADEATIGFVDAALGEVADEPLLVVGTTRPEIRTRYPRIWASRHLDEVNMRPLGKKACERIARHVLGDDIGPRTLEQVIHRADGNAFYLEELIRQTLVSRNDELPMSIVTMVQSRLALLEERDRRILRAAAILGEGFCASGIAMLLGEPEQAFVAEERLQGLVESEVLVRRTQSRFADEVEFAFRHMLLREGAYAMLTDRDRILGHRLAGEWLEFRHEADAALLAKHFEQANEGERAAAQYVRAAELALDGGDYQAVVDFAQRGASLTQQDGTLAKLRAVEAVASLWNGQLSQGLVAANEALGIVPAGSKYEGYALNAGLISALYLRQFDTLDATAKRLLEAQSNRESLPFIASALLALVSALSWAARREAIDACMQKFEELMAPHSEDEPVANAHLELARGAVALYLHHDHWGFMSHSRRAVEWHATTGVSREMPLARVNMASGWWLLGLFERAEAEFKIAIQRVAPLDVLFAEHSRSRMLIEQGRFDEAERLVDQCSIEFAKLGEMMIRADSRLSWVDIQLRKGNLDAAMAEMDQLGSFDSAPYLEQCFGTQLARIRLLQGQLGEASVIAERTYAQSLNLGMGYCVSHAQLLHLRVEAFVACGNVDAARDALRIARDDLLRRARLIPDVSIRRPFLENLSAHRRTLELVQQWFGEDLRLTVGASST